VLSGLRTRGLADRVLVIVPARLAEQRREELERKFVLPTAIAGNAEPDVAAIIRCDRFTCRGAPWPLRSVLLALRQSATTASELRASCE